MNIVMNNAERNVHRKIDPASHFIARRVIGSAYRIHSRSHRGCASCGLSIWLCQIQINHYHADPEQIRSEMTLLPLIGSHYFHPTRFSHADHCTDAENASVQWAKPTGSSMRSAASARADGRTLAALPLGTAHLRICTRSAFEGDFVGAGDWAGGKEGAGDTRQVGENTKKILASA